MKVRLIGRSIPDMDALASFLSDQALEWRRSDSVSPTDELVEFSGRICYLSFSNRQSPKSNTDYIRHLIEQGHESVLEHVSWTFLVEGLSRACTHQMVRHRVGFSFSQLSQQYHDESDATFIQPDGLEEFPEAMNAWSAAIQSAKVAYKSIASELDSSVGPNRERLRAIRTAARSILPNATETKIVVTANARAWRHFLSVRGCVLGDIEMRILSAQLLENLKRESPAIFSDFDTRIEADGKPVTHRTQV